MKVLRFTLITLLTLCSGSAWALKNDSISITGRVVDSEGEPLPVVIVEQKESKNFVFSSLTGEFTINMKAQKKHQLIASLISYTSDTVNINNNDTTPILFHLAKETKTDTSIFKAKKRYLNTLGLYVGYTFQHFSFNRFYDLYPSQIDQLNHVNHFLGFGFQANIRNIYVDLGFAYSPTLKERNVTYRHFSEGKLIYLNLGYSFAWYNNKLLLTPYAGFNTTIINDFVAPLDPTLTLDDYLQLSSLDINFKQFSGAIGTKIDYQLFRVKERHAGYLSLGVAYVGKLHTRPYIYSKGIKITSPNSLKQFPLMFNVSFRYSLDSIIKF